MIVDKIDRDRDGYVTEKELEDWVRHVANRSAPPPPASGHGVVWCVLSRYIMDDVMRQWGHYDTNENGYVTWEEFRTATFGEHPGLV